MKKFGCNPTLNNDLYICDVEAKVFGDRIYLYGTNGNENAQNFHVYSSSDMQNWTDHGVVFTTSNVKWCKATKLWAPDCVLKDGIYYLYYSLPSGEMGVAKSSSPVGPFQDERKMNVMGIDPSIFIDDDGTAYIYWGQLDGVRSAKLKDCMTEIDESTVTQPLTVKEHAIHEGSSVKKINGKYYYVYTETHRRNKATCQGYSVSDYPLSGYKYKGVIVDCFNCDPESWNNHGCIQEFRGQWYIFYHRATEGVYGWDNPRQLCIEKIRFDNDGLINEVLPTSSGQSDYILATETIGGYCACEVFGGAYVGKDENNDNYLAVKNINPYCTVTFRYLKFLEENTLRLRLKGQGSFRVDIYIDGKYHDFISGKADMTFSDIKKTILPIIGVKTVEFKFYGLFKDLTLDEFSFSKE